MKVNIINRVLATVLLLAITISNVACGGPLAKLEALLPYAPTAIDFAVSSGRISAELGAALKDDISEGTKAVNRAKTRLAAGENKIAVYVDLGNDWRVIFARNHFAQANDVKIALIAATISAILNLVLQKEGVVAAPRSGPVDYDKEISKQMDLLEKLVKEK